MIFHNNYPYTDFHELNLDWILKKMLELSVAFNEFEAINKITFSGTWNIANQYPAWTIVIDNNIGYISKQPVPAGVLINNSTYWERILDYTYSNQKRRFILISDSYGEVDNPWTIEFKNRLLLSDDDCYISVAGGYGFKPPYNAYFETLLRNIENSVTNKDSITDIIVVGGFNDRSTAYNDLMAAIQAFITYAKSVYQNARVWIGGAGWAFNFEFCQELKNGAYLSAYKACSRYGAYYLNGIDYIMHDKDLFKEESSMYSLFLTYQYVHPTDESSKMIADCVIDNINGAAYSVHSKSNANITPAANVSNMTGSGVIQMMQDDESIEAWFSRDWFYFTTPEACNFGERYIELGTVADGKIGGASMSDVLCGSGIAMGFAVDTNGNNQYVPIRLTLVNNRLYATISMEDPCTVLAIYSCYMRIPITMA